MSLSRSRLATLAAIVMALSMVPRAQEAPAAEETPAPAQARADQEKPPPPPPAPPPGRPAAPRAEAPPPPPAPPQPPPAMNVKVDLTITDQSGSNAPIVKTLSLVQASGFNGAIRTRNVVHVPPAKAEPGTVMVAGPHFESLPLNVDARPDVLDLQGGKIRLHLQLNYSTLGASTDKGPRNSEVTKDIRVVLENGKPLIVSQSADAASDRKVTVEVKATILK